MDIEELTVEPDAPRSWINDIHDQIDNMTLEASWRRDLSANVHIDYDPMGTIFSYLSVLAMIELTICPSKPVSTVIFWH